MMSFEAMREANHSVSKKKYRVPRVIINMKQHDEMTVMSTTTWHLRTIPFVMSAKSIYDKEICVISKSDIQV